ncbi:CFI-box-CTERM domain-containing protein [[Eubacterium] cellulosolvens]
MRKSLFLIVLLAIFSGHNYCMLVNGQQQIPFDGMTLNYHVETTNDLKTVTNLQVNGWSNLRFYDVSSSSSKLIVTTTGTLTQNGEVTPLDSNSTIDFPTDRDTLIFLRNGGKSSIAIYAGPSGLVIPYIPGFTVDLTRTWSMIDMPIINSPLGTFSTYRYRTQENIPSPYGTVELTVLASYDKNTQILVYGEVVASMSGFSAIIGKVELREANLEFTPSATGSPQCVIATATYGSELSPEVQFLREFRDQDIMHTMAGREFMTVFHGWYYSFSPNIASVIAENPMMQNIFKILLYPLIGILHLSAATYSMLNFNSEIAVVMAGFMASALIGVVYFSPIGILLSLKKRTSNMANSYKMLLFVWFGSLICLIVGEFASISGMLMIGTSVFVLSSLSLFALIIGKFSLMAAEYIQNSEMIRRTSE